MTDMWNILVVDDDRDIHAVSRLALSRFEWKGKKIKITSAFSLAEARTVLTAPDSPVFEAAIIDVVMETNDAGLKLCEFIRKLPSRATRIIVRTGQAGIWPEAAVLQDYPIDCYFPKGEATQERLASVVRTCLQASEDIRSLTEALTPDIGQTSAHGVVFAIDDEASNLELLRRTLSRICEIDTFQDPREALAAACAKPPDLILLDFRMPGLGGDEFLDQLRQADVDSAVLFLTAYPDEPAVERAVESEQVFWTVAKPFEPDNLRAQVSKVLSMVKLMKRSTRNTGR